MFEVGRFKSSFWIEGHWFISFDLGIFKNEILGLSQVGLVHCVNSWVSYIHNIKSVWTISVKAVYTILFNLLWAYAARHVEWNSCGQLNTLVWAWTRTNIGKQRKNKKIK